MSCPIPNCPTCSDHPSTPADPVEAILAVECRCGAGRGVYCDAEDSDWLHVARIRLALSPEAPKPETAKAQLDRLGFAPLSREAQERNLAANLAPKPGRWNSHAFCAEKGVCLAKPEDPASMHGEMCQDMTAALGPKAAEAATCASWCNTTDYPNPIPNIVWFGGDCIPTRGYCTPACRDAGKPVNPVSRS